MLFIERNTYETEFDSRLHPLFIDEPLNVSLPLSNSVTHWHACLLISLYICTQRHKNTNLLSPSISSKSTPNTCLQTYISTHTYPKYMHLDISTNTYPKYMHKHICLILYVHIDMYLSITLYAYIHINTCINIEKYVHNIGIWKYVCICDNYLLNRRVTSSFSHRYTIISFSPA
jgi:hypothetical protein